MRAFPAGRCFEYALVTVAAVLTARAGVCLGQQVTPATTQEDRLARPGDGQNRRPVVELATEPVRMESVALTFFPPAKARVQTSSIGGNATIEVYPENAAAEASWYMVIKAPRTSNQELTATQVADSALVDLIAANGLVFDASKGIKGTQIKEMWQRNEIRDLKNFVGFGGLVQERTHEIEVPGFPGKAEQFYVSLPSGKNQPAIVRGYTAVKVAADRFVTFELFTTQPYFEQAKDIYTVLLHAASIGDPAAIAQERSAAVSAGLGVIEKLTIEDMDALVAAAGERWERRYRPVATHDPKDADELGYRRIRVWKGKRGELDTSAGAKKLNSMDSQEGYLVQIDARLVEGQDMIDSKSLFFVTPDRSEEAWTVSLGVQGLKERNKRAYSEVGVRTGKTFSVTVMGTGNGGVVSKPIIETAGYISRVDSYLLPRILVHTKLAGDFGFYVFQSDTGTIRLRRDMVTQPEDRPDAWIIRTRIGDDSKEQVSTYSSDGTLVSSILPDGTVWEPTTLERVAQLWRSKGMPMN